MVVSSAGSLLEASLHLDWLKHLWTVPTWWPAPWQWSEGLFVGFSIGSLQTDSPHDHIKAFSGEAWGQKQPYTISLSYGLRLWFSDTADLPAGCLCPSFIASLALLTDVHGIQSSGNYISCRQGRKDWLSEQTQHAVTVLGWGNRQKCMVRDREKAPYSYCWVCLDSPSVLHLPAHNWGQTFAWFLPANFRLLWKTDYKNKVEFKCLMQRKNRWPRNHLLALSWVYFSFKVFSFTSVLLSGCCAWAEAKVDICITDCTMQFLRPAHHSATSVNSTASECSFHLNYHLHNFVVLVYFLWVPQSSKCIQVSEVHLQIIKKYACLGFLIWRKYRS